jgi:uncharacterized ubiquitin-like protein YukD
MPFAVVTVETASRENVDLALPLDVASRALVARIMLDLGIMVGTGEKFDLFIKTGNGDKLIPPTATLGQFGIRDGQHLRIKRRVEGVPAGTSRAHAFLRTQDGVLLALEASNVIIGRRDTRSQTPVDLDLAKYDPGHAVSRRHACIRREATGYYLLDLESTNGTRLKGETLAPGRRMPLQDGDTIDFGLGGVRVTFVVAVADTGKRG